MSRVGVLIVLVCGLGVLVLALLQLAALHTRVPMGVFTRDPLQLLGAPFYTGIVSNLGVLIGFGGAAVCLFAGAVLPQRSERSRMKQFLLWTGILTAVLVVDDLFMLHDIVIPDHLHIREQFVYAAYVVVAAAYAFSFWRVLWASGAALILIAVACAGLSVLMDQGHAIYVLLGTDVIPTNYLIEDGTKFVSIASWAAYGILRSYEALERVREQ
jgi:hypothetical protein